MVNVDGVLITRILVYAYVCFVNGEESLEYTRLDETLIDNVYSFVTALSAVTCCAACSADERCASVSFSNHTDTCLLNDLSEPEMVSEGFVTHSTIWVSYIKRGQGNYYERCNVKIKWI